MTESLGNRERAYAEAHGEYFAAFEALQLAAGVLMGRTDYSTADYELSRQVTTLAGAFAAASKRLEDACKALLSIEQEPALSMEPWTTK